MTTHSIILSWEIPWTEEPGGLQFTWSQREGHDLATKQQVTLGNHVCFLHLKLSSYFVGKVICTLPYRFHI